ncbi:MAG: GlsB/YeaQ/YmgE family stress response membrane protein [Gemmatimonadota bacterium]
MTVVELIVLLFIAGVCGSVAQALVGFTRGGCLASVALGFIGALVGTWLARTFALPEIFSLQIGGQAFPIVWSIVGAIVVVLVIGLLTPGRRR